MSVRPWQKSQLKKDCLYATQVYRDVAFKRRHHGTTTHEDAIFIFSGCICKVKVRKEAFFFLLPMQSSGVEHQNDLLDEG